MRLKKNLKLGQQYTEQEVELYGDAILKYYYYFYKWHRFLLPIHHPIIKLGYDRQGAFRFIFLLQV